MCTGKNDILNEDEENEFKLKLQTNKYTIKQALKTYFITAYDNYNKNVSPITYDIIKKYTGIGKSTLSDFFSGSSLPTIDTIIKLATFLNLDLNNIFNENIFPTNTTIHEKDSPIDSNTKETRIKNLLQQYYNFEDEADDVIKYINYIDKSRKSN